MSTQQNLTVHAGEDWKITFSARDEDGGVIPLQSGTECEFRISNEEGPVLTLAIGEGITVTNPANGDATIKVSKGDQEHNMLEAGTAYSYEIVVFASGDFYSVQAEGQLIIEASLFDDTPIDPRVFEFHIRFPEFTEDDAVLMLYLRDATRVVDAAKVFDEDDYPVAVLFLVAHYLQMRQYAKIQYESGGMQTGPVRMIRVEDRTVSYGDLGGATAGKIGLSQTFYGQQYLAMLRKYPQWLMRA